MRPIRREILLDALKLFDLTLMIGCFLLTTLLILRESRATTFSAFLSMRIKVGNFVLFSALLLSWHAIFSAFGLYDSRRMSGHRADAIEAFKATTVGTLLMEVTAFTFRIRMISLGFLLIFWAAATVVARS